MAKVTITGLKMRKDAKDHKSVTPLHKPKSKPGVGNFSYSKTSTPAQDKKYNTIQM